MRGSIWILLGAAACSNPEKGGGPMEPAESSLCIDPHAPGGTSLSLIREDHPGLVVDGDDKGVSKAETGRVTYAVMEDVAITAGEGCGGRPCSPQVVRVADGKIDARTPLPSGDEIRSGTDYPFVVDWLSLEDGDGDGTKEAWVSYQIMSNHHVAVFALPDLGLRFTAPYRHDATLDLVDADCDGDRDLVLSADVFVRQSDGSYTKD